jgi:predicted nucleotidyltransferase
MLLKDKYRQILVDIFSSVSMPLEVWAYGSRVSGKAHEGSDLDLVVRSPNLQKLPVDVFMELKEKIQLSNIPIIVELFDWARLTATFHQNIEARHEVLFSNLETIAHEPPGEYTKKEDRKSTKK